MHRFSKWREALQAATSQGAVVEAMERYVDSLPFSVMEVMPPGCVLALTTHPLDVQAAALAVIQAELFSRSDHGDADELHEVAHTFAAAAIRMSALSSARLAADD